MLEAKRSSSGSAYLLQQVFQVSSKVVGQEDHVVLVVAHLAIKRDRGPQGVRKDVLGAKVLEEEGELRHEEVVVDTVDDAGGGETCSSAFHRHWRILDKTNSHFLFDDVMGEDVVQPRDRMPPIQHLREVEDSANVHEQVILDATKRMQSASLDTSP